MIYLLTNGDEERLQIAEIVARAYWPQYMRSKALYISTPTHAASPTPFFICVDLSISEKKSLSLPRRWASRKRALRYMCDLPMKRNRQTVSIPKKL